MNIESGIILAIIYHDPRGRLVGLIERSLPLLVDLFAGIAVQASASAGAEGLSLFERAGALVQRDRQDEREIALRLGGVRANALRLALTLEPAHLLHIDGDRVLHWAEQYPRELAEAVARVPSAGCTVFGRTQRAFDSHPRPMRETETVVNRLFASASGLSGGWDVMVGARGLSRAAAESILAGCPDEAVSVDVSWPLYLLREGFTLEYATVEGLAFETGDASQEAIDAAGGYQEWLGQLERDPRQWAHRFRLAQIHCEAIARWTGG